MKKLMIAAAVAAGIAGTGYCAVESSNVVGYSTLATGANPNMTGAMNFQTVGGAAKTAYLNDFELPGCDYGNDWIQFINPATGAVDPDLNATFYDSDDDDRGWWGLDENADETPFDAVSYPNGTAFLCGFVSSGLTFNFSGEVPKGSLTFACGANPNCYVGNMYPGDIEADDMELPGCDYGNDWIQFINPATGAVNPDLNLTFYDSSDDDRGWWGLDENADEEYRGTYPIGANTGFLCGFVSSGLTFNFGTALAE